MKILVLFAFLGIVASLGSALYFMMKGGAASQEQGKRGNMVRALALRVGLSVLLFICILVAWKLGYIQPTGLPAGK